jgi:uncharacterized membrane protein
MVQHQHQGHNHRVHHHSGFKVIGIIAWFVTALAAIALGLVAFNIDVFKSGFIVNNLPWIVMPLYYIIGISGIISLLMFFKSKGCCCGDCKA